ncbi:MAG: NYN domain-containing protein [Patescibacteria group bacterium]|nr:NYN domain-containing protein [Patescibacteria group bacterium]MDD4304242.1 NYN domain-containing protein [Patescibacteria group bacterium]MDD4695296.1 NYN domain-containing protein [Patescibacteria group bacterium]
MKNNNYAFIDSQNLHLGILNDIYKNNIKIYSGWKLDYRRFRTYLKDKYNIQKAFLFIGYKPGNQILYTQLQESGYICIFKPTLELKNGIVKGNVDAELVLHAIIEFNNYNKALIISGDGDFHCLVEYLINKNKLKKVLIPNKFSYSCLLDKLSTPQNNILDFINDLRNKLEYKEKSSRRD